MVAQTIAHLGDPLRVISSPTSNHSNSSMKPSPCGHHVALEDYLGLLLSPKSELGEGQGETLPKTTHKDEQCINVRGIISRNLNSSWRSS
jgi:hypothetical protein